MNGGEGAHPLRATEDDPRFTIGLTLDVAEVLASHGYPRPTGVDLVDLQQVLYGFLYVGGAR